MRASLWVTKEDCPEKQSKTYNTGIDTYYVAFPSDRLAFKLLVYGVFIIETLQVLLLMVDAFDIFVKHLGDLGSLDLIRLYSFSGPVLTGLGTLRPVL